LAGKWLGRGASGLAFDALVPADACSFISAAKATAPKPLAERRSISRREREL